MTRQNIREMEESRSFIDLLVSVLCAIVIAACLKTGFFELAIVKGESMLPTLENKQILIVDKVTKYLDLLDSGDIVICHYPNRDGTFVKRIIGVGGDTIEVKGGYLYRNGEKIVEDFIKDGFMYEDFDEYTVPEGCYFVMGDNRNNSLDSRYVGPLTYSQIVGKVKVILFPFGKIRMF